MGALSLLSGLLPGLSWLKNSWPILVVLAVALVGASGLVGAGAWVRGIVADRAALAQDMAEQAATIAAYQDALEQAEANARAVTDALSRAHTNIAIITADRAAILEDLRHAEVPDCPVPAAVHAVLDRMRGDG